MREGHDPVRSGQEGPHRCGARCFWFGMRSGPISQPRSERTTIQRQEVPGANASHANGPRLGPVPLPSFDAGQLRGRSQASGRTAKAGHRTLFNHSGFFSHLRFSRKNAGVLVFRQADFPACPTQNTGRTV
jgi:hypothetical protein